MFIFPRPHVSSERGKLISLDDKTRHNRGILELILWYESPSEVGCLRKIDKRIAGPWKERRRRSHNSSRTKHLRAREERRGASKHVTRLLDLSLEFASRCDRMRVPPSAAFLPLCPTPLSPRKVKEGNEWKGGRERGNPPVASSTESPKGTSF